MAPKHPTSLRLFSIRTIRIALLLGLVAGSVTVLSSTSLASSISQRLFAAIVSGGPVAETHATATDHALSAEAAAESATMLVERRGHTATRLADGRVLIAGGDNSSGTLNQSELFDPSSATFSAAANMTSERADHSATLLADGRVLIAGGRNGGASLTSTEIFDPASGAFTSGPSMGVARAGHSATLLANGRVLIAGGDAGGSAEVFDPAAGTFTAAGNLGTARSMHSAALLQDGRVLLVGGRDASGNELDSGEIFDTPASAFWTIGNELKVTRVRAHLRVLFDGKVQIIGGSNDGSMEIYDPVFEGFGAYAHVLPESDPCAGLSGQILTSQTRAALFHNGQADALLDRSGHTITELNGAALVLGGVNSGGAVLSSSAVLGSSSAAITTDYMDYAPGDIARISGRGFQPGEVVRVKIHEDPHTPQERGFDVTADAEGNFSGEYLVMDYDLDMKFIVGSRGLTSGRTAQTTFTDANSFDVTPLSQTVAAGSTNTFVWTFTATNAANVATTTFTVPTGWTAPQTVAGPGQVTVTAGTCAASLNNISGQIITINQAAGGCNNNTTFTLTYSNATAPSPAVTTVYTFINQHGQDPQVTVTAGNVNTTTTVANATATYGDTSVTLNATVTPASGPAVNNGSVTFTVKQGLTTIGAATTDNTVVAGAASVSYALPAGTDAGPYTIEASYTPGTGFNASSGTGTLTINKRPIEVTADAGQFKIYGDADPTFTYTITSGSLVPPDTFTGALSRVSGEDAGLYAITIGSLAINDGNGGNNYNLTFVSNNFEIKKRSATWTTNPNSKTYGDPDPVPLTTGSGSNFVAGDGVTATYSRVAGENVTPPTYHITATLSATPMSALNNYIITNNGAEFSINKRAIQVTADAGQFKIYGDADPTFTYSITSGSLAFTDTFTGALSRVSGEDAGLYAITIGTLAINDGNGGNNYNLTFVSNDFEIKKRPATWTTNPNSKTYGDPDPVPLTTGSGSNFLVADGVTATYSRVAGENASPPTYHITATLSATPAAALNNYIITNNGAEFTINKRAIEVTADAGQFKIYGDADPVFTYSITSGSLAFTDTFTGALSRVGGEDAGLYAITIGSLAINDGNGGNNYNLTFVSNNFEIKKRSATWTTNPNSKTYGDPDPVPLTTGSGSNFLVADNVTATYARVTGENASPPTYHITATLSSTPASALNNYDITNTGAEFTINKRAIEVTADAGQFKIYGDADPAAFTYSITSGSLAFSDTFTGALVRVPGENAGLYAINIGTLAINDGNGGNNYNLTFVSNDFEIKKRPATWTTNPNSKTYGDLDPVPLTTGSGSNFLVADGVTATYSRATGENASPPTYHITATLSATPLSALDNYIITNNGAEFTINKRAIEVTADAGQFKIYGDADPTFTYTLTSGTLAFSDTFTGALSRVPGQNIGLYALTVGTLTVNDGNGGNNYNLTFVSKNFEIKKRPITVKADAKTKTFGDPDPVFTYQITSGSLAFSDTFTGALTRDPGELVGTYAIKIGTLAINDGNGGNNYTLTFVGDNLTILTACSVFNGFLSPIGGSVETLNGGSFADPVRAFKLNSTIPVKFTAICFGAPLTTGVHTLTAMKMSSATDGETPIDATPTDAATTGNQFRFTGTEWHFNMNTKGLGNGAQGTWLLKATLFDGSIHTVWISIKK